MRQALFPWRSADQRSLKIPVSPILSSSKKSMRAYLIKTFYRQMYPSQMHSNG